MPLFPKVTSPCAYKSQLSAVMDGDFCRMCQRQVFDLSAMDDDGRRTFLAGCDEEETCVSYRLPMRAAIAAAALAAVSPAMAQDQPAAAPDAEATYAYDEADMGQVIIVGGIKPARAEMIAVAEDASVPELPIVYEDASALREQPVDRPAISR